MSEWWQLMFAAALGFTPSASIMFGLGWCTRGRKAKREGNADAR